MKWSLSGLFVFIFLIISCKNNSSKDQRAPSPENKFIPVNEFIKGEISYVDSMPLALHKIDKSTGGSDSSYIKQEEFHQIAKAFMPEELSEPLFEKEYYENSFFDQTTNSLTFTYATHNKELQVTRVDVLANGDPGHNRIKSIYIEKKFKQNDSSIIQKLYWRSHDMLQIMSSIQKENAPPVIRQMKVIWGQEE